MKSVAQISVRVLAALCAAFLMITGCATVPGRSLLLSEYHSSASGFFRYRIPEGWIDLTKDGTFPARQVRLVRPDYASAIEVNEVTLGVEFRNVLRPEALEEIAGVLVQLQLNADSASAIIVPVTVISLGENDAVTFTVRGSLGDSQRWVVLSARDRCIEARMWIQKGSPMEELVALQDAFVSALQW